jgi:hypothetical protein
VIQGAGWAAGIDGYGLYITGDHWWVEGIRVANAAKGIMLDNASHVRLIDVEVDDIGQECIHVRDGSSHTLIDGCHVHDCGKRNDGFGEGIYIGSDNSVWKEGDGIVTGEKGLLYSRECHFNTIQNTEVGPNITAEPFDIKEGSTYTLIENCTVYGPGVSGNLFADSFVDIKGCRAIVRNNNFIQGGNSTITRSVMIVSRQNAGVPDAYTARDNYVHDNTFNINPDTYIGFSYTGSENIHMWNNERVPAEGLTYTSRIIQSQPADYTPPE